MTELKTLSDAHDIADSIWEELRRRQCRPRATCRLEFHPENLTFRDAIEIVPYLAELGISHVYASPCFHVASNVSHGYAIVDTSRLNPALGSPEDYREYIETLHRHGMGQILDIVPNHMSTSVGENLWWTDVLEHGQSSPFAEYFDIDWDPVESALKNRILLPVLGDSFGAVLERGELSLIYSDGGFYLQYYERRFPLDPVSNALVFEELIRVSQENGVDSEDLLELQSLLTAIRHLPPRYETDAERRQERIRESRVIRQRIRQLVDRSSEVGESITRTLTELNGDVSDPASFARLERLLDQQAYRLSRWKAASDEINYRRFFDVNELAAISTERLDVFQASHQLVLQLLAAGDIDGVRVDHVDGLFDPLQYLWRLQWSYISAIIDRELVARCGEGGLPDNGPSREELRRQILTLLHEKIGGPSPDSLFSDEMLRIGRLRAEGENDATLPPTTPELPLTVYVEKILGANEHLPENWPVAGTTGYEFLNQLNGLFVDAGGYEKIKRHYQRFVHTLNTMNRVIQESKRLILDVSMPSELQLLAHRLKRLANCDRHSRDFTLNNLLAALSEIMIDFPVYRTYLTAGARSANDVAVIQQAIRKARRRNPAMDREVFAWMTQVLLQQWNGIEKHPEAYHLFIGRFQQVTSPVMAKGIEDTAFYRHIPLVSVNEVGGHPDIAPVSLDRFHAENLSRQLRTPHSMLCTSTHDTKRSEDVRMRINALSEVPDHWRTLVSRQSRRNRRWKVEIQGELAPSPNDELLLYQITWGIWPAEPISEEEARQRLGRLHQYMEKAIHEEKENTSWISPHPEYESAVTQFTERVLLDNSSTSLLGDIQSLQKQILQGAHLNSVSAVLLKNTSPGVPDLYQGQEVFDDSLVDPDNRRKVDFGFRKELLAKVRQQSEQDLDGLLKELIVHPCDPRFKLFVTWRTLQVRKKYEEIFTSGVYQPLTVQGPLADYFCAFARRVDAEAAIVIAPRLCCRLLLGVGGDVARFPELTGLEETSVQLPDDLSGKVREQFTGKEHTCSERIYLKSLLGTFPLGLLVTS